MLEKRTTIYAWVPYLYLGKALSQKFCIAIKCMNSNYFYMIPKLLSSLFYNDPRLNLAQMFWECLYDIGSTLGDPTQIYITNLRLYMLVIL